MNFQIGTDYRPTYATKKVLATGRTYRHVMITQTEDGYTIQDARGNGHDFRTLQQAIDWIDSYFSKKETAQR